MADIIPLKKKTEDTDNSTTGTGETTALDKQIEINKKKQARLAKIRIATSNKLAKEPNRWGPRA